MKLSIFPRGQEATFTIDKWSDTNKRYIRHLQCYISYRIDANKKLVHSFEIGCEVGRENNKILNYIEFNEFLDFFIEISEKLGPSLATRWNYDRLKEIIQEKALGLQFRVDDESFYKLTSSDDVEEIK